MTATPRGERWRVVLLDRGFLLVLVTLIVYIWIAPRHIVDGDNAEFSTLGALGGTAHPTGYPLYLRYASVPLLSRRSSSVNLFSAFIIK